jgi:hypothetical protein
VCVCLCMGGDTIQYGCGNVSMCDDSMCECEYVCVCAHDSMCSCVNVSQYVCMGGYESVCVCECV